MTEPRSAVTVEYSSRRPSAEAWCARSDGHITYAPTREEALERHRRTLETHRRMLDTLQCCAAASVRAQG
ncbi:MAG: hypothetical protein E7632_02280 [Ruminococcaceae bacterium]|nr:hypothetical protein [Oscillospiraceae bacterium]